MSRPSTNPHPGAISYAAIVGKLLQMHREARQIPQAAIARQLGLTQSAYSRLEGGQSPMSITQLRQAARAVGANPQSLLDTAEKHAIALTKRGVKVMEDKPTDPSAILIGLGVFLALLAGSK